MKKLFSLMMAAFIGLTAFAAEEKSSCPAGTLVDGKVIHELECCTIVQEQGESTTALTTKSPWPAPKGSVMTITPKEGVNIENFVVNTGNTTYATYFNSAELTNATKVKDGTKFTITLTDGTKPVVIKFVKASQFKELTVTYTQAGGSVTPEPEDTTVVTPEPEPTVVYTVAGQPAALFGTEWDAANAANNMTLQADGTYKWEKADVELEAGKVEYKVVKDGNWNTSYPTAAGVNAEYTIAQKGKYDVTITFNPTTTDLAMNAVLDGDIVTPEPEDTTVVTPPTPAEIYTVAGSPASLFGTEWDPANTANIMTMQADGTYKWEKTNMELSAITIQFKVVKGNKWGTEYPSSNYELKIAKSGKYTVTITFNPNGNKVNATATLQEEVEVIPTVVIAGDMNEWNTTANTFTMAADKQTATLALNLEAKDYGFKMIIAGSWLSDAKTITRDDNTTIFSGANLNDNSTLKADVAGEYAFTWTYKTNTLTVTYPEAGEEPGDDPVDPNPGDDPVVEPETGVTYNVTVPAGTKACYIAGEMNTWSFTEMTKVDETHYTITIAEATTAMGYKYCSGPSWDYVEKTASGDEVANRTYSANDVVESWLAVYEPAGEEPGDDPVDPNPGDDPVVDPETGVTYNVTVPAGTKACYIAGEMNGWSQQEMTKVDETHYTITIAEATTAMKYKYCSGPDWAYVEMQADGVTDVQDRTYSANDVVESWKAVYDPTMSAVDNVAVGVKAVKVIRNGQMYIIRNGVIYNAMGQIAE